ncbi:hypothetical protein B0H17DRAFT_1148942 [Mycena rosella]|uniref:Uncharacterized protein n=1 Tax=Mycena rosella TaxID=1033263 RepID=A0AAD7C6R9_MYCRO|nr:hypothetical protein B0H17DRAFT_1148942 [Mycena rosella]
MAVFCTVLLGSESMVIHAIAHVSSEEEGMGHFNRRNVGHVAGVGGDDEILRADSSESADLTVAGPEGLVGIPVAQKIQWLDPDVKSRISNPDVKSGNPNVKLGVEGAIMRILLDEVEREEEQLGQEMDLSTLSLLHPPRSSPIFNVQNPRAPTTNQPKTGRP